MDKDIKIIAVTAIAILAIGSFIAFMPNYKTIEMSGYTFEVPDSNAEVKNNTINYNTYMDTENDLNIKTWACKDINDINGTATASVEMGTQLGENYGTNITHNNISLLNKSGTYTYYDVDTKHSSIILITSKKLETIDHILETMEKPDIQVDQSQFNMETSGLILSSNADKKNNTTTQTSTAKKSKTSTTKTSKSGSSPDTIYGEKISERHDFMGDPDIEYLGTNNNIYLKNKKTGKIAKRELDEEEGVYVFTQIN